MAASSGTSSMESEANSRIKPCESGEDLISALPDCLLHHILSFLPSTRDSIRTSVLSKRWLLQWSYVPLLIFDPDDGMSLERFSNFIEKALSLHNCSRIKKFVIDSKGFYLFDLGSKLATWIHFAVARDVKELILEGYGVDYSECYHLPLSFYESASFVKFRAKSCAFTPDGNVSWRSLKALYLGFCYLPDNAVENVLNGCPAIEYLELIHCEGLEDGGFDELSVVSKSLKMVHIFAPGECTSIEICCPNLEKLELLDRMECPSLKLKDLPPSVSVTLDFEPGAEFDLYSQIDIDFLEFVKEVLLQVQHVNELSLGAWVLMILSQLAARGDPCLSLNNKCLTVMDPLLVIRVPGLVFLLRSSSMLEKFKMQLSAGICFQHGSVKVGKKFWELNESLFSCLTSSLKTVEIESLSDVRKRRKKYDKLLKFAKFILKNDRVLEKMALLEKPGQEMDFANEICQKLSGVRKSSPHAVVEVARLPRGSMLSSHEYDWDKFGY